MLRVEVDLVRPEDPSKAIILSWKIAEHEAALVWFGLFTELLRSGKPYFVRYTGFVRGPKTQALLIERLNHCIDVINRDGRYFIPERAPEQSAAFSQEFSNAIHHHFEVLIGQRGEHTSYYLESNADVVCAVRGLNYHIHDLEALDRNTRSRARAISEGKEDSSFAGIVVESDFCRRVRIPEPWYPLFSPHLEFGDLVCHYSQIGKTWLEVFYDRDMDILDAAIQPHFALSGEFDIMFGELNFDGTLKAEFERFIRMKGRNPADPELRVGHLKIGELQGRERWSKGALKDLVGEHSQMRAIRAIAQGRLVYERTLETNDPESSDLPAK